MKDNFKLKKEVANDALHHLFILFTPDLGALHLAARI